MNNDEAHSGGYQDFRYFGIICLIILGIVTLFELGIMAYAFVNADSVYCDWWHCETKQSTSNFQTFSQTIVTSSFSRNCFMNGEIIDCNTIEGGVDSK